MVVKGVSIFDVIDVIAGPTRHDFHAPCPATFDLARRVKTTQVYFKVKTSKKT
jgi:hypothetical protein